MWAVTLSEGVQAALVTTVGGILVAVITRFSRQNARDHAVVQDKLDKLTDTISDTHLTVRDVQKDVQHLRKDHNRLEARLDRHLEEAR